MEELTLESANFCRHKGKDRPARLKASSTLKVSSVPKLRGYKMTHGVEIAFCGNLPDQKTAQPGAEIDKYCLAFQ